MIKNTSYKLLLFFSFFLLGSTLFLSSPTTVYASCTSINVSFNPINWTGGDLEIWCDGDANPGPSQCTGSRETISPGQSTTLNRCSCLEESGSACIRYYERPTESCNVTFTADGDGSGCFPGYNGYTGNVHLAGSCEVPATSTPIPPRDTPIPDTPVRTPNPTVNPMNTPIPTKIPTPTQSDSGQCGGNLQASCPNGVPTLKANWDVQSNNGCNIYLEPGGRQISTNCKDSDVPIPITNAGTYTLNISDNSSAGTCFNRQVDQAAVICNEGPTQTPLPTDQPGTPTPRPGTPTATPTNSPTPSNTPTPSRMPTPTPTPAFSEDMCKCDDITSTPLFPGQSAQITAFSRVDKKDANIARVVDVTFTAGKIDGQRLVNPSISNPIPAVLAEDRGTYVRYKATWTYNVPNFPANERQAAYQIIANTRCAAKTTAYVQPQTRSVLAATSGFLCGIIPLFPWCRPTDEVGGRQDSPSADPRTNSAPRNNLQLEPLYPGRVTSDSCNTLRVEFQNP